MGTGATPITSDLLPPEPWMEYELDGIEFAVEELTPAERAQLRALEVEIPDTSALVASGAVA